MEKRYLLGFMGPLIGLCSVFLSIGLAPDFSWEENALSDLGHWFRVDIGPNPLLRAAVFNVGLIITGIMISYFAIELIRNANNLSSKIAFSSFLVTGILLSGIGIFSENLKIGHTIAAVGFFLSLPITLALVGVALVRVPEDRWYGTLLLIIALVNVIMFRPWTSIAIWELTQALGGFIAFALIGLLGASDHLSIVNRTKSLQSQNDLLDGPS